jgi:hypothetical protein
MRQYSATPWLFRHQELLQTQLRQQLRCPLHMYPVTGRERPGIPTDAAREAPSD